MTKRKAHKLWKAAARAPNRGQPVRRAPFPPGRASRPHEEAVLDARAFGVERESDSTLVSELRAWAADPENRVVVRKVAGWLPAEAIHNHFGDGGHESAFERSLLNKALELRLIQVRGLVPQDQKSSTPGAGLALFEVWFRRDARRSASWADLRQKAAAANVADHLGRSLP